MHAAVAQRIYAHAADASQEAAVRRLNQILAEPDLANDETDNCSDKWTGTDQDPGEGRPDADSP